MIVVAWPISIFSEYILPIFSYITHVCIVKRIFPFLFFSLKRDFHDLLFIGVFIIVYCLLAY